MILLIGESANRRPTWQEDMAWLLCDKDEYRVDFLLSLGAFANGCRYSELGITWDASLNLLPPGAEWDKPTAVRTAQAVMRYIQPSFAILAGRRVCGAFGLARSRLPTLSQDGSLLCLPHPSGRSRCWNDPETARRCADLWQEALAAHDEKLLAAPPLRTW